MLFWYVYQLQHLETERRVLMGISRTSAKSSHLPTLLGMSSCAISFTALTLRLTYARVADKFGRKVSFYIAWLWLVVVSEIVGKRTGRADIYR